MKHIEKNSQKYARTMYGLMLILRLKSHISWKIETLPIRNNDIFLLLLAPWWFHLLDKYDILLIHFCLDNFLYNMECIFQNLQNILPYIVLKTRRSTAEDETEATLKYYAQNFPHKNGSRLFTVYRRLRNTSNEGTTQVDSKPYTKATYALGILPLFPWFRYLVSNIFRWY